MQAGVYLMAGAGFHATGGRFSLPGRYPIFPGYPDSRSRTWPRLPDCTASPAAAGGASRQQALQLRIEEDVVLRARRFRLRRWQSVYRFRRLPGSSKHATLLQQAAQRSRLVCRVTSWREVASQVGCRRGRGAETGRCSAGGAAIEVVMRGGTHRCAGNGLCWRSRSCSAHGNSALDRPADAPCASPQLVRTNLR